MTSRFNRLKSDRTKAYLKNAPSSRPSKSQLVHDRPEEYRTLSRGSWRAAAHHSIQEPPLVCSHLSLDWNGWQGAPEDRGFLWQVEILAHRIVCLEAIVRFFYDQEYTAVLADDMIREVQKLDLLKYSNTLEEGDGVATLASEFKRFSACIRIEDVNQLFASQIISVLNKAVQTVASRGTKQSLLLCRGSDTLVVHLASLSCVGSEIASQNCSINYHHFQQHVGDLAASINTPKKTRPPPGKHHLMEKIHPLVAFDPKPRPGQIQHKPCFLFFDSIAKCDEYIGSVLGGTHTGTLVPIHAFHCCKEAKIPSIYSELPPLPDHKQPVPKSDGGREEPTQAPKALLDARATDKQRVPAGPERQSLSPVSEASSQDKAKADMCCASSDDTARRVEPLSPKTEEPLTATPSPAVNFRNLVQSMVFGPHEAQSASEEELEGFSIDDAERSSRPSNEFALAAASHQRMACESGGDPSKFNLAEFCVGPEMEDDVILLQQKIRRLETDNISLQIENKRLEELVTPPLK